MSFQYLITKEVLVIFYPHRILDAAVSGEVKQELERLINSKNMQKIVVDLAYLEFIDSSGIGVLISLLKQQRERGSDIRLSSIMSPARAIFEIVRMYELFEIYPTHQDAVVSYTIEEKHEK